MALIPRRRSKKPQVQGSAGAITRGLQSNAQLGTTYKSGQTALAQIPRPSLNSEQGSSTPIRITEIVPDLASNYQRSITWNKMRNDAGVDASLRVIKTPILGADFYMEPYSSDPMDVLIAQFVWDNLSKGLNAPLVTALEDILTMFDEGYSALEKVYEQRPWSPNAKGANSKTYTMLKKLAIRPPATISLITYDDNGGPKQLTQQAIQADNSTKEVVLDISKLIIFTFGKQGGDIRGKSVLRTAYQHWYYKNHLYKIDAIQKERHAIGVPRGTLGAGATDQDKINLHTMLRNLRTNEEAYIVQTTNVTVDFAELQHSLVDVLSSADHHNQMIMLNVLAQFLTMGMGHGGGGGRATAGSGQDIFMKALRHVANSIAQSINMFLVPELVVWNFPTTNFPQLKVRNIGETRDLQMFASALSNLFAQDAITSDPETENWLREVFDMPSKSVTAPRGIPTRETISAQGDGSGTETSANGAAAATPTPPANGAGAGTGAPAPANGAGTASQRGAVKAGAIKTGNVGKGTNPATG